MADTPLQTVFNDKYITSVPTDALARWGVTDLSQIGTRNWDFTDPTSQEGSGTIRGVQFYNKNTGEPIGTEGTGFLGEGGQIGVDAKGNIVGVLPATNEGFFSGLFGRVKDIVTNPGLQYIAGSALLGNLAAGNLGTLGAAGTAATPTAEAAMADLMATEAAGAGTGALSGLSASQIANLAKAGVSVAGLLGAGSAASKIGSGGGTGTGTGATTLGSTNYSPEYYAQLQQYYNKYLPGQPADVVSPLANWYESKFNTPAQGMLTPTQASAGIRMGGMVPETVKQVQQMTVADKARTYTDLLNAGLTDTQAKNVVEAEMGAQTPADWSYLQNAAQVQNVSASTDPLVKAQEYNKLLTSGMTDAQVRSLVEAAVGPQTDTDWQYLQQLASR